MTACGECDCWLAGGEEQEDAEAQEDNEDVTTKEDTKPDSLVSAYWETIGTCDLPMSKHILQMSTNALGAAVCSG